MATTVFNETGSYQTTTGGSFDISTITLPTNSGAWFELRIVARHANPGTSYYGYWHLGIYGYNASGTHGIGSQQTLAVDYVGLTNSPGFSVGSGIIIQLQGVTSQTIDWTYFVEWQLSA